MIKGFRGARHCPKMLDYYLIELLQLSFYESFYEGENWVTEHLGKLPKIKIVHNCQLVYL